MVHVITQKVYTFPDIKLYGEYCSHSLNQLRLQIVKGEITQQLCIIEENGFANCFDEYGHLENWNYDNIFQKGTDLLKDILKAQMEKRKESDR